MFVDKGEFKFPLSEIKIQRQKVIVELQVPLKVTIEEIALDLHKFAREFPVDSIPHVEGPDVSKAEPQGPVSPPRKGAEKPSITAEDLNKALHEVDSDNMARLIGLIGHMVYWCVFGHVNQLPLDEYHKKQLFIAISQIKSELEGRYVGKKRFALIIMPLVVLAIRVETEIIFKNSYPEFFSNAHLEKIAMALIWQVITRLLDPDVYFSRFSFLESGKEAIDLKSRGQRKGMLPHMKNKFTTRSALVSSLIPQPSEGKVRKMFRSPDSLRLPRLNAANENRAFSSNLRSIRRSAGPGTCLFN